MANFTTFNCFTEDLLLGGHIVGTHTYKVLLTASVPLVTNTVKSNLTQIANGGGYITDGTATTATKSLTGADTKLFFSDVVFTGSGAGMAGFRYATVYNVTNNKLVGFVDAGSTVTLAATDDHTVNFDNAAGAVLLNA